VKTHLRRAAVFFFALALLAAPPTPQVSPDALRGDVSFLASDLLEGRGTPSRGLDIAAEYIAAQFRCAGLEPAGGDGYFQTAHMLRLTPGDEFEASIQSGGRIVRLSKDHATVVSLRPLDISGAPVYKLRSLADLRAAEVRGKVLAVEPRSVQEMHAFARAAASMQPTALVVADADGDLMPAHLIDPDEEQRAFGGVPRLALRDTAALTMLKAAKPGDTGLSVTIRLPAPAATPVQVRNVIGLLRGSDPALRHQVVLLTAHYDHLGMAAPDRIYHGANDDGSGTASVIEIARALAALPAHPKRSIVFLTFFGEEEGCLGSRYYVFHPRFPLDRTVADLNLEQLGRTDSNAGREIRNATLTGFDYSNVPRILQQAGELTGIQVYKTPHDDDFFDRSDNWSFAARGIPAHTIAVAFDYPDYHAVGDTWQKIDYRNLARVDGMIALGTLLLANRPDPPHWNPANPKVARFLGLR
jgi:Peptidase family M28